MKRVYNFSAGPSMLPIDVLKKVQDELLDFNNTGMSILEISHRSKDFDNVINEASDNLRKLMDIPANYKILFLQGGASSQFSAVPLNLMITGKADYIISGNFANIAANEAKKYGIVNVLADSKDKNYSYIPKVDTFSKDASYVHICMNNTIYGTQYHYLPNTKDIPLVADISSCILSRPIDVSKFGLLYAGAQKNISPAGLTIVIIRDDLLGKQKDYTPLMLNYKIQADKNSMYNTPPCFQIYFANLVFKHLLDLGGLKKMEEINNKKAKLLYDYLDNSKLFKGTANKEDRSNMNVCFVSDSLETDASFCELAKKEGLVGLKGHRLVGGMRASIYNAMPIEGVEALVNFMKKFEEEHYA